MARSKFDRRKVIAQLEGLANVVDVIVKEVRKARSNSGVHHDCLVPRSGMSVYLEEPEGSSVGSLKIGYRSAQGKFYSFGIVYDV